MVASLATTSPNVSLSSTQAAEFVDALDLNTSRDRLQSVGNHKGDVSDSEIILQMMNEARPRIIFHIAYPDSMVILPKPLLIICSRQLATLQASIFTSTSSAIHDNTTDLIDADEIVPILRPPIQKHFYTLTKAAAEVAFLAVNRKFADSSMLTVSIRGCAISGLVLQSYSNHT